MAKKTDPNRDKTSQPSGDTSFPGASTSGPKKTILSKVPKHNEQIKLVEKIIADKIDVNMSKTQVPFIFEGYIAKIKITMPLIELITQDMYRSEVLKVLNM